MQSTRTFHSANQLPPATAHAVQPNTPGPSAPPLQRHTMFDLFDDDDDDDDNAVLPASPSDDADAEDDADADDCDDYGYEDDVASCDGLAYDADGDEPE